MMVSGSDIYNLMSPYLKGEYHIIAPDQGGHGKAGAYVSADDEYKQLKEYLLKNGYTDIKLVYGASLGVAVGWSMRGLTAWRLAKSRPVWPRSL